MKNKIICSYGSEAGFGFGDFLRGSLHTKTMCDEKGFDFDIDFSKHEIGKYISTGYIGDDYEENDINYTFNKNELFEESTRVKYVCRNSFHWKAGVGSMARVLYAFAESIPEPDLKYFKRKIIFSNDVVKELEFRLKSKNISSYKVIQVRTGDNEAFSEDGVVFTDAPKYNKTDFKYRFEKHFNIFTSWFEKLPENENFIFISDNSELKDAIKKHIEKNSIKNIFVLTGDASHTSRKMLRKLYDKPIVLDLFETAIDLCLLSKSKENISLSCYNFSSNFCQWISLIFNVRCELLSLEGKDLLRGFKKNNNTSK